ncbi:AraC family transcriptional regulator [Pseudoalteromonas sp. MMG010]|uniref:AraC family transcriptional regulator n=1 Tax=Pseudoalteromonas sp. MMG010 TaxID=2822685 RepID=UPI001B3A0E6F|nr:AraC family transcriptional regulator [Pseudoalteromonas sp. MMG010]MBQ4832180.1 AraC family transcriptional regulator [Pseudoalteromonas sp. MMG010]
MNYDIENTLTIGPRCVERFIDPNVLAHMAKLEIALAGCSNLSGDYCVARTHPVEHTLFYTLSGEGEVTTANNKQRLEKNSLLILPAKQAFEVKIRSKQWNVIWLNLANTKRWQHLQLAHALVLNEQSLTPLHLAMEILYVEKNPDLRDGVIPIISHYLSTTLEQRVKSDATQRITNLFQQVQARLQYDWTIEVMCEKVHYSAPHLHRLCQAQYGRSPMQQLIYLRIIRAQHLLLSTSWSIAHIASYVGYPNIFNFSKRFKKSVGISPSQFRCARGDCLSN